jgi:hypothetical protein
MGEYRLPALATWLAVLLAVLPVSACGISRDEKASDLPVSEHVTLDTLASKYSDPNDWHRLALYANWDFVDVDVWQAIVVRPECDRATALAIFWKASPEYYLAFNDRSSVPAVNLSDYDLINLIRERWQSGAYVRTELAFDPDTDAWPLDFPELRRRYGTRVDQVMPASMRVRLEGRQLKLR